MFKLKVNFSVDSDWIFMNIYYDNYEDGPLTFIKKSEVPIDLMWTRSLYEHKLNHGEAYYGEFLKLY